jgi:hypothetical protein
MSVRYALPAILLAFGLALPAWSQTAPPATVSGTASGWRVGERTDAAPSAAVARPLGSGVGVAPTTPAAAAASVPRRPIAKVIEGPGTLPNTHGQVWREYDISPYTLRVTSTNRPEQAIVDWILRETGYEAWHGDPLGVLSATSRTLRVYHTPDMQALVADIVDRFVSPDAESFAFEIRVVALDQPNWRTRAQSLLRPVTVHTPGVQAWLLRKEDSAMLLSELRRRSDYRELSRPQSVVNNGRSTGVLLTRGKPYIRDVVMRNDVWPGYEPQPAQIDEGFLLEFMPLLSLDRRVVDATLKCDIDQVEKLVPVLLDVPTTASPRQRTQIDVPQISRCRFHERFRWPVDQVLLVNLGMVAMPIAQENPSLIAGLPLPTINNSPTRADVLVFLDGRGDMTTVPRTNVRSSEREAHTYHGRY